MPAGRPTKLTVNFIEALQSVLDEYGILILTDEDLLFLVNQKLKPKNQISAPTFKNWKAGKFDVEGDTGKQFLSLIKSALVKEKMNLIRTMRESDPGHWQKYAWIIERKFDEWNIKNKQELSGSGAAPIQLVIETKEEDGESDPIE